MNVKGQFEYLYKIVNHKLFLLKIIRPCLSTKAALSVAKSMILSLIDYGNIFLTEVKNRLKALKTWSVLGPPYRRLLQSAGVTEDLFITRELH